MCIYGHTFCICNCNRAKQLQLCYFLIICTILFLECVRALLGNSSRTLQPVLLTSFHTILTSPTGDPCHFSSFPTPSVLNGLHSLSLIGECKFCHHLINVQVSARTGSSAPVGTSVHAHPCSYRGVRHRKTHTHIRSHAHTNTHSLTCTCKVLSLWLLKAKLGRLWSHSEGE